MLYLKVKEMRESWAQDGSITQKTDKVKYLKGSIHLSALTSGILTDEQQQRPVSNRVVNIQGGNKILLPSMNIWKC